MEKIKNKNKISVVILAYRPSDKLAKNILMCQKQNIHIEEIIIMCTDFFCFYDNMSEECAEVIKKNIEEKKVIVYKIDKKDFNHGRTRNIAVNNTKGDFILFMTDDAVMGDEKVVSELFDSFNEDNVAVSYARQFANTESKFTEKLVREFNYPKYDIIKSKKTEKELGIKNYFVSNVCAMYDKEIFLNHNGFRENILLNEDMIYSYKVINNGYSVYYKSTAIVYHSHDFSYIEQFKRNYLIGHSQKDETRVFKNVKSEKEGFKLVKFVSVECIKKFKIISLIAFYFNCIFRYMGYLLGKFF